MAQRARAISRGHLSLAPTFRLLVVVLTAGALAAFVPPGDRTERGTVIADTLSPARVSAPTPDSLAALFLDRFANGSAAAFDSVDPDPESRVVLHSAIEKQLARRGDLKRVVARNGSSAVLLLTGTIHASNGGDETNLVRHFSGLYEATQQGGAWTITRQIPIDTLNHIRSQALDVQLTPGTGIHVLDTLYVAVGASHGLAMRLNNAARIADVRVNGQPAAHAFGGGVLWVETVPGAHTRVVLDYRVDRPANDTAAAPVFGAFHNTDVWQPFFGYNSANDLGRMAITVRIPAEYHLTTTLPQTESVANGVRTVRGRSNYPAWLLSLIYDRDWRPRSSHVDGVQLVTFTTSAFPFSHDTLAVALRAVDRILHARFGGPNPPYVGVVEDPLLGKRGFSVRMTDDVVSGTAPVRFDQPGVLGPSSAFAHEVSHAWTMNATGPAANMLREGWATFAESAVLRAQHGTAVERDFWERIRNGYMLGSEGRLSILGSPDNGGVHYSKGSWIFHMFDNLLGDAAFDRGIREYVQLQTDGKPAGYEELIAAMSHAAGRDLRSFALPWFTEKVVPDVTARVSGHDIILTQNQATVPFELPLDVALVTGSGHVIRRTFHLTTRSGTFPAGTSDSIVAVHVDPDRHLLLRRHWGETVRFELPVARAGEAKAVAITSDMSLKPIPATLTGHTWVVEIPLTEGRFIWSWQLDGKPRAVGEEGEGTPGSPTAPTTRVVLPLQPIADGFPR